jgi:hypothetical protein
MAVKLTPQWRVWRKKRRLELIANGLSPAEASEGATREAQGRARIAEVVGTVEAKYARVGCVVVEGRPTYFLIGDRIDDVPLHRRDEVAAATLRFRQKFGLMGH